MIIESERKCAQKRKREQQQKFVNNKYARIRLSFSIMPHTRARSRASHYTPLVHRTISRYTSDCVWNEIRNRTIKYAWQRPQPQRQQKHAIVHCHLKWIRIGCGRQQYMQIKSIYAKLVETLGETVDSVWCNRANALQKVTLGCVYCHGVNVFVNVCAIDVFIEPTVRDNEPVVTTYMTLHHSISAVKYRYGVHCRR